MPQARKPRKTSVPKAKAAGSRARTRVADKAAAEAKSAGAVGKLSGAGKATAAAKALRDSAIVARYDAGVSPARIAAEFEVSRETVHRVVREFHAAPSGADDKPMEIVESLMRSYRKMRSDFQSLATQYADTNPQAAIGALRQARETLHDYVQLLGDIGKLPDNLELFRAEAELLRLADLVIVKLGEVERGETDAAEMARWVRQAVLSRGPLPVVDVDARELDAGD